MPKKLKYNDVKEYFEEQGCFLLEDSYINAHYKMKYKCICGNDSEISWMKFRIGRRCKSCAGVRISEKKKFTLEHVKNIFKQSNCELLEKKYKNSKQLLLYKCSCGNKHKINLNNFSSGKRCPHCGLKKIKEKQKLNYNYVKKFFESKDCVLLESEYINSHYKMRYVCSCKNKAVINWNSFRNGSRCRECGNKKISESNKKYNTKIVQKIFKKDGCELLGEFKSTHVPMKYKCSCKRISHVRLSDFLKGNRCKCGYKKNSGLNHPNWIVDRKLKKENDMFRKKLYSTLSRTLCAVGDKKNESSRKLLGYTPNELRLHIINHLNWENVHKRKWHLDHIFPIKAFLDHNIKDIKIINALDNLQPLEQKENLRKSDIYDIDKFNIWISQFEVPVIPTNKHH